MTDAEYSCACCGSPTILAGYNFRCDWSPHSETRSLRFCEICGPRYRRAMAPNLSDMEFRPAVDCLRLAMARVCLELRFELHGGKTAPDVLRVYSLLQARGLDKRALDRCLCAFCAPLGRA